MQEIIEIPLSKIKIGLLFVGALAFVIVGLLFIVHPGAWAIPGLVPAGLVRAVGVVSAGYFALCAYFIWQKLTDGKMGLTIDGAGITDNSSANGVGLIEWEDIIGVQIAQSYSSKILLIMTRAPEKYIQRVTSKLFQRSMWMNNKLYGSPIGILSSTLKVDFGELERLIAEKLRERGMGRLA